MDPQLLAFVTAAKEQSFTKAAKKLHISQPTISHHILSLEQRLNVKLFERTHNNVCLNKAGEVVFYHAQEILDHYKKMEQIIHEIKEEATGPLNIGACVTFGEYVLPQIVAKFRTHYPKVMPSILIKNPQTIIDLVAKGQIDIGVIEGKPIQEEDIVSEQFLNNPVAIVVSNHHPLTTQSFVTAKQLEKEHWIVREEGSGAREITNRVFYENGIHPMTLTEFNSIQVIKEFVETGLGVSLLSRWVIRKELALNTLREIPFTEPLPGGAFFIVTKKSTFQAKAEELFRQFLREISSFITSSL